MTSPIPEKLSDADIKVFLETAPLYAWREFKNPQVNRSSLWIKEIDAFCENCGQRRPFQDLRSSGSPMIGTARTALMTGTSHFQFSCVSCKTSHRIYLVEQILDNENIRIQKYGELPRMPLVRNHALQKFLKDDLENYEKAIVCLSHEYGVAAFAYFRRVVENNINKLLDLVQEDAQSSAGDADTLNAINELRSDSHMSEKIKVANRTLPSHLKPDGLNPLGRLYQVLSEGVHNFSDAECLEKAKATSECLAFLVSELASRSEHRTQFKSTVGRL